MGDNNLSTLKALVLSIIHEEICDMRLVYSDLTINCCQVNVSGNSMLQVRIGQGIILQHFTFYPNN